MSLKRETSYDYRKDIALLAILWLMFVVTTQAFAQAGSDPDAERIEMIEGASKAVVLIKGMTSSKRTPLVPEALKEYFGELADETQEMAQRPLGAGFIYDAERGAILTAGHVVENARAPFYVELQTGEKRLAALAGIDAQLNLAVLTVEPEGLSAIPFADAEPKAGQSIFVLGRLQQVEEIYVTRGMVSSASVQADEDHGEPFVMIDALIPPGSGGGPVINRQGEAIGVASMIYGTERNRALGFATPTEGLRPLLDQLATIGKIRRSRIGIFVDCEIFEDNCIVTVVEEGSPAHMAGLAAGDELISMDGMPIKDTNIFARQISSLPIGSSISLTIQRKREQITKTLVTVERDE